MKRVLLTGATGFVGANLARRLLADGHEVHVLVRSRQPSWRTAAIHREIEHHRADIADGAAVEGAVAASRPEWVFHLAAHGAYAWQSDARRIVETNFRGTINLLDACLRHGVESFVNSGSSVEYGFRDDAPAETEVAEPCGHYAVAKRCATDYCRIAAQLWPARVCTLRLYSVYGPFEEPGRLIPALVVSGLGGELPALVDPCVARDFVHVDDVCDAYVLAASTPRQEAGAVYNVGTGVQTTVEDAVRAARALLQIGCEPRWRSMPRRAWDTNEWVCNNALIREQLGWRPRTSFADGLRRTLEWFRGHPELLPRYRRGTPPS